MATEDQREAVKVSVTLGGQLMTAALAVLAIEGAFITFALGNRNVQFGFYVTAGLTFLLFVASIFLGGKGVTQVRNAGFQGNWRLEEGKAFFNWQAALCLIGLLSFALTLFLSGSPKATQTEKEVANLQRLVGGIQSRLGSAELDRELIQGRLEALNVELRKLEVRVKAFERKPVRK